MVEFDNRYNCIDCKHCLNIGVLKYLNNDELNLINRSRSEVSFKKGEIIYKQGAPLTHLVVIHSGLGKIYLEGHKGKNLILTYTNKNNINGGLGVFMDQRHHTSLMAVSDCDACYIEIRTFKKILDNNSRFRDSYLKEHSQRVAHHYSQFLILTQKNMEGRIAESILYLKDKVFINGSMVNLSKQDIADLTAMTKESAIRVLKQFKDDGIIEVDNHSIQILNKKALEQIALHG